MLKKMIIAQFPRAIWMICSGYAGVGKTSLRR